MPFNAYQSSDNFAVTGSMTVINDPNGNSGNVNVQGTLITSGTASFASGLSASSISAGGLNSSFTSGLTVTGGINYDAHYGGTPSVTTSSQSVSASGAAITMTSGLASGQNVVFVSANSTTATCVLTPTASASTSGDFQNGLEITLINLAAAGSNVLLPSTSMGSLGVYNYTLSAGHGVTFKYISSLQTWIPLASA